MAVKIVAKCRNHTSGAVISLKRSEFLGEQLNESTVSLRGIKRVNFAPLTPVVGSELNFTAAEKEIAGF